MTTRGDLLRDKIVETINTFNPEYWDQCPTAQDAVQDLVDDVEEFTKECEEPDSKEEAIREINAEIQRNIRQSLLGY